MSAIKQCVSLFGVTLYIRSEFCGSRQQRKDLF